MEFLKELLQAIFRWVTGVGAMVQRLDLFTVAWRINLAVRNALVILMNFLKTALQVTLRFAALAISVTVGLYLFNLAWRNELVIVLIVLSLVFIFLFAIIFPSGRVRAARLLADVSNLLYVLFFLIWVHWVTDNGRYWTEGKVQNLSSSELLIFFIGMLVIPWFGGRVGDFLQRLASKLEQDTGPR